MIINLDREIKRILTLISQRFFLHFNFNSETGDDDLRDTQLLMRWVDKSPFDSTAKIVCGVGNATHSTVRATVTWGDIKKLYCAGPIGDSLFVGKQSKQGQKWMWRQRGSDYKSFQVTVPLCQILLHWFFFWAVGATHKHILIFVGGCAIDLGYRGLVQRHN